MYTVNVLKFRTLVGYKYSLDKQSTQIRLLLEKKSDQGLPVCFSDMHFVNDNKFYLRTEREKGFKILEHSQNIVIQSVISHKHSVE